jgi:mono/diheme cytochrome c family protein
MIGGRALMPPSAAVLLAICLSAPAQPAADDKPAGPVFARTTEAMQLLEGRCIRCHDQAKSRGNLNLSTRAKLLRGGETGPAIVPGAPAKSLLYQLVTRSDESAMPKTGAKLTEPQRALLASWINAGAPYDRTLGKAGHNVAWWSLQSVKKPTPLAALHSWPRNPIDHFVLEKLLAKGLQPSPTADRRTLIRRVTFDLIGLPPTPNEIADFLGDASSVAYEKVVDRLLASPHFGERWARHWMDAVHFAETHGHDQDVPREHAWPYRDYLIDSFNQDKPYGRFVVEQIAGDVLYPDDPRATVALGFLAAGPWDESSLRDIREDTLDRKAAQYLDRDDMLGTVGLALLSSTVQCARCHDHKFDPISQREYYGLQAVFAGVDRANRTYDPEPKSRAQRLALLKRKQMLQAGPSAVGKLLEEPALANEVAAWEKAAATNAAWQVLDPVTFASANGCTLTKQPDGSLLSAGPRPERDTYSIAADTTGAALRAIRLEVLSDARLPHGGPGRQDNGNLHLSEFRIEAAPAAEPAKRHPVAIARAVADFDQAGWGIERAIDGKPETAWGIYPRVGTAHAAVFVLKEPLPAQGGVRLFFTLEQQHGGGHLIGRPRLSATSGSVAAVQPLPPAIQQILARQAVKRTDKDRLELAHFTLTQITDNALAALPPPKLVYAAANDFVPDGSFRPAGGCRPIHVLKRGDVRNPLELARPGALACVAALPAKFAGDDEGQRRAALAQWISDPRNPLTWRSIANRVWQHHFGRGIVATPSDFGRMGATPSHPELLDWLTATLLEDGGSLKKLHRLIVTSSTYTQSSAQNPAAAKVDADNVLLSRMNVTRLDAESMRDAVLAVSGKLDCTMGGPSVKHFLQSPGIHRTPKVDYLAFDPDSPGAHRRSVYRFIFRTVPDPFMDALDCPDASQFTAVRPVSVTALQALALLNDPFMIRMSEHFATRLSAAGGERAQIRFAYRLALGRDPRGAEEAALAEYARRHGMANACRVLLNCNEFAFVP